VDRVATSPIKFFNDLDVLPNGDIIFSDSSHKYARWQNRQEVLDGAPRGRLVLFSVTDFKFHLKLCGLHFPNGVQQMMVNDASKNERNVMVSDSARFRLMKVNINHPFLDGDTSFINEKKRSYSAFSSCNEHGSLFHALKKPNSYEDFGVEILTDSLPGFTDNIRYDVWSSKFSESTTSTSEDKHYYFISMGAHSFKPFSLLHFIYQRTWIRDLLGKFVPMKYIEHFLARYGLVVIINEKGEIITSLHDTTGKGSAFISQMERNPVNGDYWIESHSEKRLVVLPFANGPKNWE
jgi:hypothetical protein